MAIAATAASTAFPPSCRIFNPACAASGWLVATTPLRARISEWVWSCHPVGRVPGTVLMLLPGFHNTGSDGIGFPKGVFDGPAAWAGEGPILRARTNRQLATN